MVAERFIVVAPIILIEEILSYPPNQDLIVANVQGISIVY
jgi:hypothetical protein